MSQKGKLPKLSEQEISAKRLETIQLMERLLRKNPIYHNKDNLIFQIAELERKEAVYRYSLARKAYQASYDEYLNGSIKTPPNEPKPDYSKALDKYRELITNFPNYPEIDHVMFLLAQTLKEEGNHREMASYMNRIVKEHPKSKFRTKAYLALAEMFFERNTMLAAKTNYLKVVEDKAAPEYPFALYKLGYTYYNLQEYEDSIKAFQEVIEMGLQGSKISFQDQAYSALALSFTGLDAEIDEGRDTTDERNMGGRGWQRAYEYFREVEKRAQKPGLMVEQLMNIKKIYTVGDQLDLAKEVEDFLNAQP